MTLLLRGTSRRALLAAAVAVSAGGLGLTGCKTSDLLGVPVPIGFVSSSTLNSPATAEAAFLSARGQLFQDFSGGSPTQLFTVSEVLTDEFAYVGFYNNTSGVTRYANIDARMTASPPGAVFAEAGDGALSSILGDRSSMVLALGYIQQYASAANGNLSQIGEAYTLIGYSELWMAEDYCSGVPLSQALPGGGFSYGQPLTADSLFGVAEAHFALALTHANQNDTIVGFATVGLARAQLDRDSVAAAARTVASVPNNFSYNVITLIYQGTLTPSTYYAIPEYTSCENYFDVSDVEGINGLNFRSAHDPRLLFDSTLIETCDGYNNGWADSVWYYPLKFGVPPNTGTVFPLATGIEASLIKAESDLPHNGGSATAWLADLNAMRNSGCRDSTVSVGVVDTLCTVGTAQVAGQTVGLPNLTDPGTDSGEVSLMFRERAFWLFGTGSRLGDLRRLIRQYGRPAESVFPTGAYGPGNNPQTAQFLPEPLKSYGTDVAITLPTVNGRAKTDNPNYKGCLTPTTQA